MAFRFVVSQKFTIFAPVWVLLGIGIVSSLTIAPAVIFTTASAPVLISKSIDDHGGHLRGHVIMIRVT